MNTGKHKIMKIKEVFLLASLAIVMAFQSCSEDNPNTTGTLKIQITDAPFPHDMVDEANITISKIEVRKSDETEGESPFMVLSEEERTINLLDLTNGLTETLVNKEVPVGSYNLVRLYIKEASVLLTDGRFFDLKVPSGSQTGIKVFVKPEIRVVGGLSEDLLLDVDVSKSFVPQGNMNSASGIRGFHFKPVIKAANLSTTGSLIGAVTDTISNPLEGVQISVYAADTLNTTTFTDASGNYMVLGLLAGIYEVEAELEDFISQEVESLEIVAGNNTTQNFALVPKIILD